MRDRNQMPFGFPVVQSVGSQRSHAHLNVIFPSFLPSYLPRNLTGTAHTVSEHEHFSRKSPKQAEAAQEELSDRQGLQVSYSGLGCRGLIRTRCRSCSSTAPVYAPSLTTTLAPLHKLRTRACPTSSQPFSGAAGFARDWNCGCRCPPLVLCEFANTTLAT